MLPLEIYFYALPTLTLGLWTRFIVDSVIHSMTSVHAPCILYNRHHFQELTQKPCLKISHSSILAKPSLHCPPHPKELGLPTRSRLNDRPETDKGGPGTPHQSYCYRSKPANGRISRPLAVKCLKCGLACLCSNQGCVKIAMC